MDEIQAYPHLSTLLKFLSQDNRFTYIASGSLLGVTLSETTSVPMGSIRRIPRPQLRRYFEEVCRVTGNTHTPHILEKAFSFHTRLRETSTLLEG